MESAAPSEESCSSGTRVDEACSWLSELSEALWVVDGQQRLTSLACALDDAGAKDPRFALAYDLRAKSFVRHSDDTDLALDLPHAVRPPAAAEVARRSPQELDLDDDEADDEAQSDAVA